MKFTAAGDMAIQRMLAEYDGFDAVKAFIDQGDVRFFNLETTVNEDCFANFYSGGTWLRTNRKVLESAGRFGFNMTTGANNHCTDFGTEGLLQTIKNIDDMGYVHAGCGRNLREASAPRYLDLPQGRVALIACSTSFSPGALAGEQTRLLPGRPGINGLQVTKTVMVEEAEFEALQKIADKTGLNIDRECEIRDGYVAPFPEGKFMLDAMQFEKSETSGVRCEVNAADMARMKKAIEEAAFFADYVVISLHTHDRMFKEEHIPAEYIKEISRKFIDWGAHVILGHGPHLLRPFEVYKERPIFYSLGDFLLQLENCELAPEEFYAKFGLTSDNSMYELFQARTKDFTIGLQRQQVMMEAILPYFEMEDGKLKSLEIVPIELGLGMRHSQIGLPRITRNEDILKRFAEMSAPYGTKFEIKDGRAKWLKS